MDEDFLGLFARARRALEVKTRPTKEQAREQFLVNEANRSLTYLKACAESEPTFLIRMRRLPVRKELEPLAQHWDEKIKNGTSEIFRLVEA